MGPFSQFWRQKFFSWKIQICHAQLHMGFWHHAKILKKLMIQFKNAQTDERTGWRMDNRTDRTYFIGPFQLSLGGLIKKFIGHKNIINTYRKQGYNSVICGYFCIGFTDFMLWGKSQLDFTNSFSPIEYKSNNKIILKYFQ